MEKNLTVDGLSRTYLVFAPRKAQEPMLVVLAFHGGGGNARQMERPTR